MTSFSKRNLSRAVILIGTCDDPRSLEPSLRHVFTHEIQIPPLSEEEKRNLIRHYFDQFQIQNVWNVDAACQSISEAFISASPRDIFSICFCLLQRSKQSILFLLSIETIVL